MKRPPAPDLLGALDSLDDLIRNARPVPLTDQVRFERKDIQAAVSRLREAVAAERIRPGDSPGLLAALEELEQLIAGAPSIPLTSQIRCDREALSDHLDRMRSSFPQ